MSAWSGDPGDHVDAALHDFARRGAAAQRAVDAAAGAPEIAEVNGPDAHVAYLRDWTVQSSRGDHVAFRHGVASLRVPRDVVELALRVVECDVPT